MPASKHRSSTKEARIPMTRVEAHRYARYEQAYQARLKVEKDLLWSDWIRGALDRQADADLGTKPAKQAPR